MLSEEKNYLYSLLKGLVKELFLISLITYLLFIFLDKLFPRLISNYFDLDYLLIIIFISGVAAVFLKERKNEDFFEKLSAGDYIYLAVLGALGTSFVFFRVKDLGGSGVVITVFLGLLIFLTGYLVLNEKID